MPTSPIIAYRTKAEAVAAGYPNPYPLDRDTWLGSCSPYAGVQYRLQQSARRAVA